MNNILNYTSENGIQTLSCRFQNIRNIDDIAMRVLNRLSSAGIIPMTLDKNASLIDFNIGPLVPCLQESVFNRPEDMFLIFADLQQMRDEIKRCRIDSRYLVNDLNAVYRHPVSGQTWFAAVPCIEIFDRQRSLKELLVSVIEEAGFRHLIDAEALEVLKDTVRFSEDDEKLPGDLVRKMKQIYPECADISRDIKPEYQLQVKEEKLLNETESFAEMPVVRPPVIQTVEEKVPEVKVQAVKVPVTKTASPAEAEDEEWLNNLKEAIRQEVLAEKNKKRNGYLIRRRKGEIIALSDDVFVIGKMPDYCDFVITDNPSISKLHALIRYQEAEDAYYIIDCDSTNHIYLDGHLIPPEKAMMLKDKMIIHLASEAFEFKR